MVVGHEMAHALREHARARIGKSQTTGAALSIGASILGLGHCDQRYRSGIFRAIESLAHRLLRSPECELAFTAARQELLQAAKLVLSARRKLQSVEESGGEHALEAGPMLRELEGIQGLLEDASQSKPPPRQSSTPTPRQPAPPKQPVPTPDAGTAPAAHA